MASCGTSAAWHVPALRQPAVQRGGAALYGLFAYDIHAYPTVVAISIHVFSTALPYIFNSVPRLPCGEVGGRKPPCAQAAHMGLPPQVAHDNPPHPHAGQTCTATERRRYQPRHNLPMRFAHHPYQSAAARAKGKQGKRAKRTPCRRTQALSKPRTSAMIPAKGGDAYAYGNHRRGCGRRGGGHRGG